MLSFFRITRLLKDQDGNQWRDKLPPNPDTQRVMAALSTSTPPYSTVIQVDTPTTNTTTDTPKENIITDTPKDNVITDTPTTTKPIEVHDKLDSSNDTVTGSGPAVNDGEYRNKSDQELYEEFKTKGNEFVKQVWHTCMDNSQACLFIFPLSLPLSLSLFLSLSLLLPLSLPPFPSLSLSLS